MKYLAIATLVVCSILLALQSEAAQLVKLEELSTTYIRMFPGGVDPLVTQNGLGNRSIGGRLDLHVKTSLLSVIYWDSLIHSATDRYLDTGRMGQFRSVGLRMRTGIRISPQFELGLHHHSQHVLDHKYSHGPFPREDGLEIRIQLYRAKDTPGAILP
jgi:hypothetical protein